eukprot:scaffold5888_cov62-Phaeocystis_antarctica.AAC.8
MPADRRDWVRQERRIYQIQSFRPVRRPDTRRLPAACPRCLRFLRLTHTLTVSRHSSTERPATSASALSAATVSGLHPSTNTRETPLLKCNTCQFSCWPRAGQARAHDHNLLDGTQ